MFGGRSDCHCAVAITQRLHTPPDGVTNPRKPRMERSTVLAMAIVLPVKKTTKNCRRSSAVDVYKAIWIVKCLHNGVRGGVLCTTRLHKGNASSIAGGRRLLRGELGGQRT